MKLSNVKVKKKLSLVLCVVFSLLAGCINGLFGGGGGMVVVPIFSVILGLSAKKAHATAVATILPMSLISAIIYIVNGCANLDVTLAVGGGVIVGGIIGALVLKKINSFLLSVIFYAIMIAAGVKMLLG